MRTSWFAFVTAGMLCLPLIASAATLNVPGDHPAIQAAIDASADGDTVLVSPGVYREHIDFGTRQISLVSASGADETVIDGDLDGDGIGDGRVMYIGGGQTNAAVVEGFTIRNGSFDGYGAGICTSGASPVIRRNKIAGNATLNPSSALRHGGGIAVRGGSAVVCDNVIAGNYAHNSGAGIYTESFSGVIENNVICNNDGLWGSGIGMWGGAATQPVVRNNLIYGNISHGTARGGGIMTINAPGALLVNNTIAGNGSVYGGGINIYLEDGTVVRNCIVWGNTAVTGLDVYGTANAQWFHNDLGSDNGAGLIGVNGNIAADPLLADAANGDFHLQTGSPCIDAGEGVSTTPATDCDGHSRYDDPAMANTGTGVPEYVDMGADEFVGLDNDPPLPQDDTAATDEDVPAAVHVLANDTDPDNDRLALESVTAPAYGSAEMSVDGTYVTYTPGPDHNGTDSFSYTVSDGRGGTGTATVTVAINPVNDPPAAEDQSVATNEDAAVAIALAASDVDGDALTFAIVTPPAHGTMSGTPPSLIYTPGDSYYGPDSFTFTARDAAATSNMAVVSITITMVNDVPVAHAQSVTTDEDTAIAVTLTGSDAESDPLTFAIDTQPAHGTLTGTAPDLTYTPDADYNGGDSFTFTVTGGGATSAPATVSITIEAMNDAPVAQDRAATTAEDAAAGITLVAADVDGDQLTYTVVTRPAHGTLTGTAPNLTYTPDADYNGPDGFTFLAGDGAANSDVASVSITVTPVNDSPVAHDQGVTTAQDTPVAITLTARDVDGNPLTFTVVTPPSHGTLSGAAPGLTYTPAAGYNGPDSFAFTANDGQADSNAATVSITVEAVNSAPVAQDQAVATAEDTAVALTLAASDVDGDALTYTVLMQPAHGILSGEAPSLIYTPAADYHGADGFTFKASDGQADSSVAMVSIAVAAVNDAPVAQDQAVTVAEDRATAITLTASDVDRDALVYAIVAPPAHGTLIGTAPGLIYTPNANYNGPDGFTFTANDGAATSAPAAVSITVTPVNDTPVAQDQAVTTAEDTAAAIMLAASDVEGDALAYAIVAAPAHGTLSGTAPGLTYTPSADYSGPDGFTFTASDGMAGSNVAAVSITVTPVNDAPVAHSQTVSTAENTPLSVTLAATDAEGDALTYEIVDSPAHGTLGGTAPDLTYAPADGYIGSDSFTFTARDGSAASAIATVSITVTRLNTPPIALADAVTTDEDTAVEIHVLANDSDPDGDALLIESITAPAHGNAALSADAARIVYTPAADYHGPDSFSYTISDGLGGTATAAVTITVAAVNDAPVAYGQSVTTAEDASIAITLTAADIDSGTLTYTVVDQPAHGALSGTAPNLTYTPAADFCSADGFTFKAGDGVADSNVATVTITVTPMIDAPVAESRSVTVTEDTAQSIALVATDVDGDTLAYTIITQPVHGVLSGTAPALTYTPAADCHGADSFTFRASDGAADSNVATVSITITAVNDAPVAYDHSVTIAENAAHSIVLVATDVDGDGLAYVVVTQPEHGLLSGMPPDLTYTPDADYDSTDSFTFKASDGIADSNIATVFISVGSVNDAPVAVDQSVETVEDTPVTITLAAHDAEGDVVTFEIVDAPAHGSLRGAAPDLAYTPAADYHGPDMFTFRASDGAATSNIAAVSITVTPVNDVPVAAGDGYTVDIDATLQIGAPGVLANDTDADGDPLEAVLVAGPASGALSLNAGGSFSYLPNAGFAGTDSFSYIASDGAAQSDPAIVAIEVREALTRFRRGDANADGELDIGDAITILSYLFRHGRVPTCLETANVNDDNKVDIADAIRLLGYLFGEQVAPPVPFEFCGTDPQAVGDRCVSYQPCQ